MGYNEERAEALRSAAYGLGDMLAGKAAAYGNAQDAQRALWRVLLEPYRSEIATQLAKDPQYIIPLALIDHLPRLTRVLDRVCRIVANPSGDRMGEDTWKDLAGDAVAGMVMPRTCREPGCERPAGHEGEHGAFDARGVTRWPGQPARREGRTDVYEDDFVERARKAMRNVGDLAAAEGATRAGPNTLEEVRGDAVDMSSFGPGAIVREARHAVAMGDDFREDTFAIALGPGSCGVLHRLAGDGPGVVRRCTLGRGHASWHSGPVQDVRSQGEGML